MQTHTENSLLSWQDITSFVHELACKIRASDFVPDYLIGIARGGLIPLTLLSHELDITHIVIFSATSYRSTQQGDLHITYKPSINLRDRNVLLIDEIADTGNTLYAIADILKEEYCVGQLKTAVIAYHINNCKKLPDYYIFGNTRWIVFPWEEVLPF